MKAREFRDRLLVALYNNASERNLSDFLDPAAAANEAHLIRKPGQLRLTLSGLRDDGLVKLDLTLGGGDEGGMHTRLTSRGIEEAEDLIEKLPPLAVEDSEPTLLRYVDTAPIKETVSRDLEVLTNSVRGSNSATPEDREIALAEIAVFEASLHQPVIATDLIDRFVNMILKWIGAKFADGAVTAVVAAIILNLAPFLRT